jgi:hypothetical protein
MSIAMSDIEGFLRKRGAVPAEVVNGVGDKPPNVGGGVDFVGLEDGAKVVPIALPKVQGVLAESTFHA